MDPIMEKYLAALSERYSRLPSHQRERFLSKVNSLAQWNEEPMDYPSPENVDFPASLHIAYAVCHLKCGAAEFIVDGNTQTCSHCGGLMFRTEVTEYVRKAL
jgi:hypothetical protein